MNRINNAFSSLNPILGLTILVFFSFSISSCQQAAFSDGIPPCEKAYDLDLYELVWSDEFDGNEVDMDKWSFQIGDGCDVVPDSCSALEVVGDNLCQWGNNEKQYYTDRSENVKIENGNLVITAVKERQPFMGYDYTSARMRTKGKGDWTYCRIDARAKMPVGQGFWPAIWMLSSEQEYGGWPCSGEIDIMEYLGNNPFQILSTVHFGNDYWQYISQYYDEVGVNFSEDFHTFTLIWDESCIRFLVDGQVVGNPITPSSTLPQTYPFQDDFHLILNLAVGGNLPGDPTPSTVFPQSMEVDYVRVYQRK
jgi:beta-glucanase (GH16 family)